MNEILCLHTEAVHVLPLARATEQLRACGIAMTFCECNSFAKACQNLAAGYDAILIHQVLLCDEVFACGPPSIILERIDGAQLAGARPWISASAGVIKGYTFRDRTVNNTVRGRLFPHRLVDSGLGPTENTRALAGLPAPPLSALDLAKIRIGYGFPSYSIMESLVADPMSFDEPRAYDLHCVVTVDSYKDTEITLHRRRALEVAADWPGPSVVAPGRPFVYPEYKSQLYQSRCVLSPWGWGEPCYRDIEAMLAGAVLVKPDTDYVDGWPDVYRRDVFYRACRPDFSDLYEIVSDVRDRWEDHLELRTSARARCVEAWQPANVASRMASIIKELLDAYG